MLAQESGFNFNFDVYFIYYLRYTLVSYKVMEIDYGY